jgi:hypothetical protein
LENERAQITKYLACFDEGSQAFRVKYCRKPGKTGRATVWGSLGASSFRKTIRNTLLKGLYYDFDIVSCHPWLVINICRAHGLPHNVVLDYCTRRKEWLTDIQDAYWPDRTPDQEAETYAHAKALMLRLCFMGTTYGFRKSVTIAPGRFDPPCLGHFRNQLAAIAHKVKEANPRFYEKVRSDKNRAIARGESDWFGYDDDDEGDTHGETVGASSRDVISSMFALYLQEMETRIVSRLCQFLVKETALTSKAGVSLPVLSYQWDGLQLLTELVGQYPGGVESVRALLEQKTREFGWDLQWSVKEMDEGYALDLSKVDPFLDTVVARGVQSDLEAAQVWPHWRVCRNELFVFCQQDGM